MDGVIDILAALLELIGIIVHDFMDNEGLVISRFWIDIMLEFQRILLLSPLPLVGDGNGLEPFLPFLVRILVVDDVGMDSLMLGEVLSEYVVVLP